MAQIITFENYRPVPRYDEIPFTDARIEEAETAEGPWTELETIPLDPVDADPAHPQSRDFTTELASDEPALWYRIVFLDASGDTTQPTTPVQNLAPQTSTRDLCTIEDVRRYVPGYVPNDETDATLQALITAESEAIHDETEREIIAYGDQPASREFPVTENLERFARLMLGDLTSVDDSDFTIELIDIDGATVAETFDRTTFRPLYERGFYPRTAWDPVIGVEFPRGRGGLYPTFRCGQTLLVTGTWGFPAVPSFITEACAKRVILRYASDVATAGTQLADAIAEINLAGIFASSRDDVAKLRNMQGLGSVRLS